MPDDKPPRIPGQVFMVPAAGAPLSSERDAAELIGDAMGAHARTVAIPAARLDPAMFDLSTRLLGGFLQKFVTYKVRVAIVGDISDRIAASTALAAFVRESNGGDHVWFVDDLKALTARLARR
jgi:hypothetical protein